MTNENLVVYKRHETDTSHGVQPDGGCALNEAWKKKKKPKSVHWASRIAEGVRLHHGTTRKLPDTSLQVYQPTETWLQLEERLAAPSQNLRRYYLHRTDASRAGWWLNNPDKHAQVLFPSFMYCCRQWVIQFAIACYCDVRLERPKED